MSHEETYLDLSEFTERKAWKIFNKKQWDENKEKFVKHIAKCWGKFPSPENQVTVFLETEKKDGYRIEKYEIMGSSTGHPKDDFIPTWLLIPDCPRSTPCPCMIIHHQHAGKFEKGKEEPAGIMGDPQQAIAVELVQQGYVVATFDALGFSERQEEGGERFIFTRLLMFGMTLNGKYCYDISRVIDFLETQQIIDKHRIGIMGHSLGGQMALWGALYDPRIKVIVSSCGFAKIFGYESICSHHINHNFALYLPNLLDPSGGLDMHEVIGLLAPRPLILSNGVSDPIFPIEGVAEIHQWVEDLYKEEHQSQNLLTLRHSSGHGLPQSSKIKIYAFIAQRL